MRIIFWLIVVPGVASVLVYFLVEFIRLARRGYRDHAAKEHQEPEE